MIMMNMNAYDTHSAITVFQEAVKKFPYSEELWITYSEVDECNSVKIIEQV